MLIFLVQTNLALFNAVNAKITHYPRENAYLYVVTSDRISKTLVDAIAELKLFKTIQYIFTIDTEKVTQINNYYLSQAYSAISLFMNYLKISRRLNKENIFEECTELVVVSFADIGRIFASVYLSKHKGGRLAIIEEGAGVLYKNKKASLIQTKSGHIFGKLLWIFGLSLSDRVIYENLEKIYVYKEHLHKYNNELHPIPLPEINSKQTDILPSLLGLESKQTNVSTYNERKFIYFASAVGSLLSNNSNKDYEVERSIIDTILSVLPSTQLIIKDHPRFAKAKNTIASQIIDNRIFIDQNNYLFESIYPQMDIDSKVLITNHSATVLHPKYMFGFEPYVIFTYKLFGDSEKWHQFSLDLILEYSDKSKIFVPDTVEELKLILKEMM